MANTVTLTITFEPQTGRVNVQGPIADKMLCHGLLGMATDALREHWRANASRIVQPEIRLDLPGNGKP